MTTYAYHATLVAKWEHTLDFGLFHKKADAKKACQDEQKDEPIDWYNADRYRSFGPSSVFSDGEWVVTRRPIR